MSRSLAFSFVLLSMFIGSAGCGACFAPDHSPVPVTGQVRYQGQPVRGGVVVISADLEYGAESDCALAELGLDGSFITGDMSEAGIRPGYYRLAVSGTTTYGLQIPSRYKNPKTSGLRFCVEADQPLTLFIELE